MKFVHYISLKPEAQAAFDKGDGKHGKFAVNHKHIAVLDKDGRAADWILVIKGNGPAIVASEA